MSGGKVGGTTPEGAEVGHRERRGEERRGERNQDRGRSLSLSLRASIAYILRQMTKWDKLAMISVRVTHVW